MVPEFAGTASNLNAPDASVEVSAEYVPAFTLTSADGTEAPLASRTVPSTRVPSAFATGAAAGVNRTRMMTHEVASLPANMRRLRAIVNRFENREAGRGLGLADSIGRHYSAVLARSKEFAPPG